MRFPVFFLTWTAMLLAVFQVRQAEAEPIRPSSFSLGQSGLPGVNGAFSSLSLKPGEFVLGASGTGHGQPDILSWKPGPRTAATNPSQGVFLASQGILAIGLGSGLDGALGLPYYYESTWGGDVPVYQGGGIGDLRLSLKAALPWRASRATFSILATGTVPIASGEGRYPRELIHQPPGGSFPSQTAWPFGTVDPRIGMGLGSTLSFAGPLGPVLVHLNLQGEKPLSMNEADLLGLLRANLAVEAPLAGWIEGQASLQRDLLVADLLDRSRDVGQATQLSMGLTVHPTPWMNWSLGGRFAPAVLNLPVRFTQGAEAWEYRPHAPAEAYLGVSLQGFPLRWDRDGDGFPDSRDRCPYRAEDKDGYEDEDGCPDLDNDRDGFVDSLDNCPMAREDRDGFKDWDGCPDEDNDADGVEDGRDACSNDAEDKDGNEDVDGCPDLDDDRDGVPDASDRCPRAAETRNGFEDADGCPEADSDGDGRPDKADRCPQEAEIVNFFEDADGCPDEKPAPVQNGILAGVAFMTGNAELQPSSFPALDSLARLMTFYPGTDIEIRAHVDDQAGSGAQALSQDRARAVTQYLTSKGVEPRRLRPAGYGSSQPVDNNRTAKGRQANRRVEVRRLN